MTSQLEKAVRQIVSSSTGWNPKEWEKLSRWEDELDAAVQKIGGMKAFLKDNYDEEPPASLEDWRMVADSPFKHYYKPDDEGLAELRAAAKEYADFNAAYCAVIRSTIVFDSESDLAAELRAYFDKEDGIGLAKFLRHYARNTIPDYTQIISPLRVAKPLELREGSQ